MKPILVLLVSLLFWNFGIASQQPQGKSKTLLEAIQNNDMRQFYSLIQRGGNLDEVDEQGNSLLMVAVTLKNMDAIKSLLATKFDYEGTFSFSNGINLNIQNKEGQTAIMLAAKAGLNDLVKEFMKHGSNLKLVDKAGKTVMQYAAEANQPELAAMLEATANPKQGKRFNLTAEGGGGSPAIPSGEEPSYLKEQRQLVNDYFEAQRQGSSAAVGRFFCDADAASHLFAVSSWEIVNATCTEDKGFFKARVDSTTKGGTKTTNIWTVATMRNYSLRYCIRLVYKTE